MNRTKLAAVIAICGLSALCHAQEQKHDKAEFGNYKNEFYEKMEKDAENFKKKSGPETKTLKLDFSGYSLPKSPSEFKQYWHTTPINQGITGTCWCFSATSFFESEIYRIYKKQINLSELYTVYWEYVEKARRYVSERGNSEFGEGSEANAVRRIWSRYGVVPAEAYQGMLPGQKHHDHAVMYKEMMDYLKSVRASNAWDEQTVIATIKSILNHYLGTPPQTVIVDGKTMTPQEYLKDVVRLNMNDYVDIISLLQPGYYRKIEYPVPDNWWHDSDYYNVPLDEYINLLRGAIRKGYTMAIGGDVSEPGYVSRVQAAVVPSFDIPSEYIDENARQFRFTNGTTTDDHGLHLVGYMEKDGKNWYLIKDSGAGTYGLEHKGYYYYDEDYIRLKIMDFMVHKDAVGDLLSKFK